MHPFVNVSGTGVITLTRHPSGGENSAGSTPTITFAEGTLASVPVETTTHSVVVSTPINMTQSGSASPPTLIGSHFLTSPDTRTIDSRALDGVTKIEVETVPVSVVEVVTVKQPGNKKGQTSHQAVVASDGGGPEADRKVCLWPMSNGTTCGKTFTKFDSLKRHLSEAHKGVRPYQCNLCDKSYGRRDYLQRHLKSHNASFAVNLAQTTNPPAATQQIATKVDVSPKQEPSIIVQVQPPPPQPQPQTQLIQQQQQPQHTTIVTTQLPPLQQQQPQQQTTNGGMVSPTQQLPVFNVNAPLPHSKGLSGKICRWVLNDGTVCGKSFSKLDSLRRHVAELHKGIRPYACNMCEKTYGRRDYLERHLKTHEITTKRKSNGPIDWGPNSGVIITSAAPQSADDGEVMDDPSVPRIPKKKRKDSEIPAEEKKICLWVLEDGTACGKTFTKFDSLKRHVSELHKGVRPYTCTLCGKNYGRRDYLLRHLKSHNDAEISNITSTTTRMVTTPVVGQIVNNPGQPATVTFQHPVTIASAPPAAITQQQPTTTVIVQQQPQQVQQPISVSQVSQATQHVLAAAPIVTTATVSPNRRHKKRFDDKKTCKWALENGTLCGRNFSKFDSLRRHINELHKGIRPFMCPICQKTYGRRDYLERHMKSHKNANEDVKPLIVEPTTITVVSGEAQVDNILST